jgi:translocation and assembly module TamB
MSNSTEPETDDSQQSPQPNRHLKNILFSRTTIAIGVLILVCVAAGAWWLQRFIYEQLSPLVEKNLSQTLKRPIKVGRVERFGLTGLRLGATSVPATATDPDTALIEAVEVNFNLLAVLFSRTLPLDVILVNPKVYVQQDTQGRWVNTDIATGGEGGPIQIALNRLGWRNAQAVLVSNVQQLTRPTPRNTVTLNRVNGAATFHENYNLIKFNLAGKPQTGGDLKLDGDFRPKTGRASINVNTQDFLASDLTRLIELPLVIQGGRASSNFKADITPVKLLGLYGTADLNNVTAQVNQLPQAFNNSQGRLQFKGTEIHLDNVRSSYGKIPAVAKGSLDIEKGFNLAAYVDAVSAAAAISTLKLQVPVPVSGVFRSQVKLTGPLETPILTGDVINIQPVRLDRLNISRTSTNFTLDTAAGTLNFPNILATPADGGKVTGNGTLKLALKPGQTAGLNFNLIANNIPGDAIAKAYGVTNQTAKVGIVTAQAQVTGTPDQPRTVVNWQAPQATYPGKGQLIIYNANNLFLRDTIFRVAGGDVSAAGELVNQRWKAAIKASGVRLGQLTQVPPSLQNPVNGTFNLAGTLDPAKPQQLTATGAGRLTGIGGGTINVPSIQVAAGRWQTQLQATGLQLQRLAPVPPQFAGSLTGRLNLAGSTTAFTPETLRGSGTGRLNVAGGTVNATNIQLANGRWQAAVNTDGVQLNRFNPQLRGLLTGDANLAGTVQEFSPAGITAAGRVRLSQELIGQPLNASLNWDGQALNIPQITSRNIQANGIINVDPQNVASITGVNFHLRVRNYDLQNAPVQLPPNSNVAGRVSFNGQITGNLPVPNIVGDVQLRNFAVNNVGFDPLLAGDVQLQPGRGLNLDLVGNQNDRIAVSLNPNYRPNNFTVKLDEAIATGTSQGENLLVNVENFPLRVLNLTPPANPYLAGPVSGILSADLTVNPDRLAAEGDVAVAQPAIGRLQGDRLTAQFRYDNGGGTLTNSEFIKGQSRYALAGSFSQTPSGPQFQAQANITEGNIQDILSALQIYDFEDLQRGFQPPDYATAKDLGVLQVGAPERSLLTQLRHYSEVLALLQQQRQQRQDAFPVPALAELQGTFGGEITASSSPQQGIAANFALRGDNWQWGKYTADRLVAAGSFNEGVLTLLPIRVRLDANTMVALTGRFSSQQQSGQLRVKGFPLGLLNDFVELPIAVTGNVDGTATVAGSTDNPQAVGEFQLSQGTINQNPVESASASFSYANARLGFGSNILIAGPEPLTATGSIPLQLPFASVEPDNDQIRLDVNVQNQGLALLNVLTDQVAWKGGEGQIQLQVRGTLQQPVATGIAQVKNATITAAALADPLTNVNGRALFNNDRIVVGGIQGDFSRGQVVAQGVIPIFENLSANDPDAANPLTVSLDRLTLNLPNLYQGGANGKVTVTASALNPVIGGEVLLANGQVFLPTTNAPGTPGTQGGQGGQGDGGTRGQGGQGEQEAPVELSDLRLTLGDNVSVTLPLILDFRATGTLVVNGMLEDLRPQGTIDLERGRVNLFTTQFELERGYDHTATFTPKQGLDPVLNVRLIASVPEVTRARIPASAISSEIADNTLSTDVGSVKTVRVRATVEGPASQLSENLELTSTPSRNQSEIVALIGGGFVQTLGQADTAVGLANIAGTALLSTYQSTFTDIGNAFGLSELRLFPTSISNEERSRSSTLGLAAEAGVDISRNAYFSVLTFLTAQQPAQFGLSYRLSDNTRIRAATDFADDTQAVVEYEVQF